ncbi:MAG: TFIIB-type zinc ribbon-containing protein, partial [Clostridium sp.]|nr:TFIIB-type zinc ribbon-containing protein [Clostridium sp.]
GYDGAVLYTCPSCGAQIVTDATTAATFCYYCHNPVVLSGRLEGSYHPDFVIPFQMDRKKAQEVFSQWIAKKRFVPREFYSPKQIETMTGVYFPYWLFSCKVEAALQGQGTSVRTWSAGNLRYTETKIYDIARQGTVDVNNVARNALKKANRRLVDGVQPFEIGEMQNFSMGYLSGFMAENRDMERAAFEMEVPQEVRDFAVSGLKSQGNSYNRVQITNQRADISEGSWQYALLPVWTLTYKDRKNGKIYYFAMNGQSGKVCGELPVDKVKLLVLFATIFLPLLTILLIVGYII